MQYSIYDPLLDVRKYLSGVIAVLNRNTLEAMITESKTDDTQIFPGFISRDRHCTIDLRVYPCIIKNYSENKTLVNGKEVSKDLIRNGDTLTLGPWKVKFEASNKTKKK